MFEKSRDFLFHVFVSFYSGCFLCFPSKFCARKLGCGLPGLIRHARLTLDSCVILRPSLVTMLDFAPTVCTVAAIDSSYSLIT